MTLPTIDIAAPQSERPVAPFAVTRRPVWCAGCGDFGVLSALSDALNACAYPLHDVVLVSGIGCSSRLPFFLPAFGFHGVHGRALPIAMGVKLANPALHVIAIGGDGDGLGIGGGHIPHVARRNPDLTYLILDNAIYGLTKGQVSPTSPHGRHTGSTPYGVPESPVEPLLQFLSYDASFVARGFSAHKEQLVDLLMQAFRHPGFAVVHIASPCPAFGGGVDFDFFHEHLRPLPEDFDPADRLQGFRYALDKETQWSGIFRRDVRPVYEDQVRQIRQLAVNSGANATFDGLLDQFK